MNTTLASTNFSRAQYTGRTDRYAPVAGVFSIPLNELNTILKSIPGAEVAGSVLTDGYNADAVKRMMNYTEFWQSYGRQYKNPSSTDRDRNYIRLIVDKRAAWCAGRGIELKPDRGNEDVVKVLSKVWRFNKIRQLIRSSAKTALVTGDAFWYVTAGKDGKIRICQLNPSYVFPFWKEDAPEELACVILQFPVWDAKSQSNGTFTAFITPEKIAFYSNGASVSEVTNPLGMVNVVHIPANVSATNTFGTSAVEDLVAVQKDLNEANNSFSRVIRYSGDPTTLVFGARMSQLERSSNKLISNLPIDAKVENLELSKSGYEHFQVKRNMALDDLCRIGRVPKSSLDSEDLRVSNTSGIAMQMMFQPLVEATIELQECFEAAIHQTNKIIAAIHEFVFKTPLKTLADSEEDFLDLTVEFKSLLPRDEAAEVDLAIKRITAGIWSKAEAIRQVSGVADIKQLGLELSADLNSEIAVAREKAMALKGGIPNLTATMLGSVFLTEELIDSARQIGQEYDRQSEKAEESPESDKEDDESSESNKPASES